MCTGTFCTWQMPSSEDGTRKSADKSCWKYTFTGYDLLL
ncbi:hypothetical protein QSI_2255 [Clostridioides difficile P28]|nr:hypothetical protein QSI_2255 [Clostridioides difficile P28]